MFPIRTKNRKAISVVMTTLIILVASVVLGTGVVLYGTSLFQTGGQSQNISSVGTKMWVNSTASAGYGWGAVAVRNSGDVLVSLNTIQIRSVSVPFSNWYADTDPVRVPLNFQANFNITKEDVNGNPKGSLATGWTVVGPTGSLPAGITACTQNSKLTTPPNPIVIQESNPNIAGAPTALCLAQQSGPISLTPGQQTIIYFKLPNGLLTTVDSGSAVTVSILAGNVGGPQTITVGTP